MGKELVKRPAGLKSHDQNMDYAVLNHLLLNNYIAYYYYLENLLCLASRCSVFLVWNTSINNVFQTPYRLFCLFTCS